MNSYCFFIVIAFYLQEEKNKKAKNNHQRFPVYDSQRIQSSATPNNVTCNWDTDDKLKGKKGPKGIYKR